MKKTLHKARVHLFVSGIYSLLFGTLVLAFPSMPLLSLVRLFSGYTFLKGIALSIGAGQNRREETHWLFLLGYGILNVATGVIAFVSPNVTLILLGFIASVNLLMGGILQVIMAIHLHREIRQAGWLIFSGIITIVAGFYIYLMPRIDALTILHLIAGAAILVSNFLVSLSWKAARWRHSAPEQIAPVQ